MDVFAASDYGVLVALPFLGGVLTHQGLFRRYQLDRYPLTVASAFVFLQFALFKALQLPYGADASSRYSVAIVTFASFFSGLCLSTIVHRAVFHPLKKFPGPFPARLSKFWGVYKTAGTRIKWYKFSRDLHAKYGDYVRIGPRELSITDPEAIVPVLGPGSKTSKGPFYGSLEQSVHTTLDKEFHRQRRRVWDNAFKVTLADFAPSVEAGTDDLISVITPTIASGAPVLINDLCQRYSFDIMCSLAFGKSGGYLLGQTGARDEAIFKIIHDSLDVIALVVHTPWVIKILENCSKIPGPMKSLNDWSAEKVEMRKKMKDPQPDLMGYLMKHTKDDAEGRTLLNAESRLIIGAGTDTAAGALTMIFAYLANHPSHAALLRAEIDAAFATDTYSCLRPLSILDATINEVLRLHPPVTWGSSRVTPADGLQIGQTYIPPNVIVSLPPCGITRDPRNFDDPNSFRPERWTTNPELIRNRAAFIPFLLGPYQCPGKGLAMMELRSVTARAVARFEVVWLEEATLAEWIEGIKDHFTMGCPALRVGFKEVGRGEERG
ncbi:cytochrome p450 [Neofusicoccum parvum]|nr:cytochrome p450 [Neofusicoccum parvum]